MRLIDADALMETAEKTLYADHPFIRFMRSQVDNAPTVDVEPPWILCEDRLPKYREIVIATNRWHDGVDIVFRDAIQEDGTDNRWGTDDRWVFPLDDDAWCSFNDFVAWMPLPKPYRG